MSNIIISESASLFSNNFQMADFLDTSKLRLTKDFTELRNSTGRSVCPVCLNKRKYFCYDCVIPLLHSPPEPVHALPLQIHIVRHNSEKVSKSSIIPLKLVYPKNVFLYTFTQPDRFDPSKKEGSIHPSLPTLDPERTAILFPSKDSVTVGNMDSKLFKGLVENEAESYSSIEHVIVIDSTWSTARQVISKTPELKHLKLHIRLGSDSKTIFWRHQKLGRECLATCEAIYVLLREIFDKASPGKVYDHRYDDILFYYFFVHGLVQENYRDSKKHRGHLPDYAIEPLTIGE